MAVLLLLQTRGRVTAAEVAEELEVSERTARRDLEALGLAGLPVYATRGRGGGWFLAGGGRTDLSGLTDDEARALYLAVTAGVSTSASVAAGLRKLQRALPEPMRARAAAAAAVTVVDPAGWERVDDGRSTPPPVLDAVHRAAVDRRRLRLTYEDRARRRSDRLVDPLGVAAKGRHWYLVAWTDRGRRTFRLDRVVEVEPTDDHFEPPEGFDLATAWREIQDAVEDLRAPVAAVVAADGEAVDHLRWVVGTRLRPVGPGRWEVRGHDLRPLAAELAGFGDAIEVLDPPELRHLLGRIGGELVAQYR